ncbi:hypothetical protein L3Q82_007971 [Scortum barcoo]|uniref:Uncharacterized protein n=1 Tax=Scortum barcoo TaxID=214431 RepID=A0ACB8WKI4_9TELE|nr:hypothetical protein L3Q82_007971 [Scortum barcoo]
MPTVHSQRTAAPRAHRGTGGKLQVPGFAQDGLESLGEKTKHRLCSPTKVGGRRQKRLDRWDIILEKDTAEFSCGMHLRHRHRAPSPPNAHIVHFLTDACVSGQWLSAIILSLYCFLPSCLPAGQTVDYSSVESVVSRQGDTAILRCYLLDGVSKGAWLNRSSIIFAGNDKWSVDPRVSIVSSIGDKHEYSLQIQKVDVTDDGQYTCSIQNKHSPRPKLLNLIVKALPGDPRGVPRPVERHSLSSVSWVFPEASSRWDIRLEHLPREASQGASKIDAPKPPQLTPLDARRSSGSTPSSSRMTELLTLSLRGAPSHPAEETHFGRLYPRSCPFGHYPKFMTIGEGGKRGIDHW